MSPGVPTSLATLAGLIKIPEPTMVPMTIPMILIKPRTRGSSGLAEKAGSFSTYSIAPIQEK
jgi:hypothetical protein